MKRIFLAIFAFAMLAAGGAQAATKTFVKPMHMGDRLDICLQWGVNCGKPAADAYCQSRGYVKSAGHTIAQNVGAVTPTRLITTGAKCDQGFCDAFQTVTCWKPSPTQVFYQPKFMGNRLDICVDWGQGCGKPAADKYCQSKGFAQSAAFSIDYDIGLSQPTRLQKTGAVCDQAYCDGFKAIKCGN